jgi:hypothetical protein
MALTTRSPAHGVSFNTSIAAARFLGGGAAADCSKVAGRGVRSVAYNGATGAYLVTLESCGRTLLALHADVTTAGTTGGARVVNEKKGTYNSTTKTVELFVVDAATPTARDIATDETLSLTFIWADTDAP